MIVAKYISKKFFWLNIWLRQMFSHILSHKKSHKIMAWALWYIILNHFYIIYLLYFLPKKYIHSSFENLQIKDTKYIFIRVSSKASDIQSSKKCILFLFYLHYWMYLNFLAKCIPQINKLWMTYSMFQYLLNHALLKYTISFVEPNKFNPIP